MKIPFIKNSVKMKYLHRFLTTEEYKKEKFGDNYIEPWVSLTVETHATKYNKKREEERQYLTTIPLSFEILSDGYLNFQSTTGTSVVTKTIEYSKDSGTTWTSVTSSTGGTHIDVIPERQGYCGMFSHCYGLRYAKIVFNAERLVSQECSSMFAYCINLLEGPEAIPDIVAGLACSSMFKSCKALVKAPELPAFTTNIDRCYVTMFKDCNKLNEIKCNSTTGNNAQTSTHYWTANVAPTGIFYKNPNTTWIKGVSGVPNSWTIIDIEN